MTVKLMPHQEEAITQMRNGCILWGGVGSGKSLTAMSYYLENEASRDVYVITTAKKRDSLDWEGEAAKFGVSVYPEHSRAGRLVVDSWNNIKKYLDVKDAFFIFDEQRVVGYGAWSKAFIQIARQNHWILLSATPGDTWLDYAPVFIANGYFKNITHFKREHVLYEPFVRYPKIKGYLGEEKLERLRNDILVEMPYVRHTTRHLNWWEVPYDKKAFDRVYKDRWNIFENQPVGDVAELFRLMRRVVNQDDGRLEEVRKLTQTHDRLIIFYNFNYELEMLRTLSDEITVAEWNGHKKEPVPKTERWVYLVQYISGAEGWNCIDTNAMILFSLTYSYKNFIQSHGRIDRLNTTHKDLYYYIFVSNSVIDNAIKRALEKKENFNEKAFIDGVD